MVGGRPAPVLTCSSPGCEPARRPGSRCGGAAARGGDRRGARSGHGADDRHGRLTTSPATCARSSRRRARLASSTRPSRRHWAMPGRLPARHEPADPLDAAAARALRRAGHRDRLPRRVRLVRHATRRRRRLGVPRPGRPPGDSAVHVLAAAAAPAGLAGGVAFLLAEVVLGPACTRASHRDPCAGRVPVRLLAGSSRSRCSSRRASSPPRLAPARVARRSAAAFVAGSVAAFGILGGPTAGGCVDPVSINPGPCLDVPPTSRGTSTARWSSRARWPRSRPGS